MPFFPTIANNSSIIRNLVRSFHNLQSWALRSRHHGSVPGGSRGHSKHPSQNSSLEDDLELNGRGASAEGTLPESPKKTPRMESTPFESEEMTKSLRAALES